MRVLILIVVAMMVLFLVLVPLVDLLVGVPPVVAPAAGAVVPEVEVEVEAGQAEASRTAAKAPAALVALGLTLFRQSSQLRPSHRRSWLLRHPASRSGNGISSSRPSRQTDHRFPISCPISAGRDVLISSRPLGGSSFSRDRRVHLFRASRPSPALARPISAGPEDRVAGWVTVAPTAITYCGPSCVNGSRTASATVWVVAAAHSPRVVEATAGNRRD